jgi:hypothetical protein
MLSMMTTMGLHAPYVPFEMSTPNRELAGAVQDTDVGQIWAKSVWSRRTNILAT